MQCDEVVREEVAERYLRGALAEAEREAYELHFLECARCFGELETYRVLRQALVSSAAATPVTPRARPHWNPWILAAAAAVVVGVGSGLYWTFVASGETPPEAREAESRNTQEVLPGPARPEPESPSPAVSEIAPPAETRPPAPSAALLAALAVVQPPAYAPVLLRGAQDEARRRFRDAMLHYAEGEFSGAKMGLESAASLDPTAPDIAFFLGICALLTGQPTAAIEQLRRTIALGESPYLEEAHFFLAKAHLKAGELEAATSQLEAAIRMRGDHEREARALLQRLEAFRASP